MIIFIIVSLIIYKKNTESFDNLESNLYSYDTCCTEEQIRSCETYGKTGVCDYYNNKKCMCQDSF